MALSGRERERECWRFYAVPTAGVIFTASIGQKDADNRRQSVVRATFSTTYTFISNFHIIVGPDDGKTHRVR